MSVPVPAAAAPPPSCDLAPAAIAPAALDVLERIGGAKLVRDLTALYVAYSGVRAAEARQAFAAGDAGGVRRACHALKSGSAQLGLAAVADRCAAIEAAAAADDLAPVAAELAALEAALEHGLGWLAARVAQPAHEVAA